MSVRPVCFYAGGTLEITHDEAGHSAKIALTEVDFQRDAIGNEDELALRIGCPICGAYSVHPASGGSAPYEVQALHILKRIQTRGLPFAAAKARVKAAAEAMEGPGRFRLDRHTRADIESGKPLDAGPAAMATPA